MASGHIPLKCNYAIMQGALPQLLAQICTENVIFMVNILGTLKSCSLTFFFEAWCLTFTCFRLLKNTSSFIILYCSRCRNIVYT